MYIHVVRTNFSLFKDFYQSCTVKPCQRTFESQKTNLDQTPLNWIIKTFVCGLSWCNLKEVFAFTILSTLGLLICPFQIAVNVDCFLHCE